MMKFTKACALVMLGLMSPAAASEPPKVNTQPTAAPVAAAQSGPQRDYNPGKVIEFPSFEGESIIDGKTISFKPEKGHSVVVIFIASWCEPCQVLMPELKQLAKKYSSASNQVFFVFSHDTKTDAAAFAKEHQLTAPSILANVEILTAFKNPELPSIYVGDKWGYLADRYIKIQKDSVAILDETISKITAL